MAKKREGKNKVRAVFEGLNKLSSQDIEKSEVLKDLLKNQVPNAIRIALSEKKIFACLFEINSTSTFVEIHRNHWIQALETIVMWHVESENYEKCQEINELIKSIKAKHKTVIQIDDKKEEDGKERI
jgi:pyoverdine/dityrosine biosynthesis protein Dit1